VDTLCIVQDDEANKLKHIEQMASVYENAQITIVAADGEHADRGIRGIGVSRRGFAQTILNFGPTERFVVNPSSLSYQETKPYFTRGWTYQEYHLSRRLLVFINGRAIFKCRHYERQEGINPIVHDFLPEPALDGPFEWPNLWEYLDLVNDYNTRKLTYDGDVIIAFFGVLTAINKNFTGGFIQGIPALYFDLALLWQPAEPLRRRTFDSSPTWSWVGWAGQLDLELCKLGIVNPQKEQSPHGQSGPKCYEMEIIPITSWFQVKDPSAERARIDNSYYHYYNFRVPNFTNKGEEDPTERDFLGRVLENHHHFLTRLNPSRMICLNGHCQRALMKGRKTPTTVLKDHGHLINIQFLREISRIHYQYSGGNQCHYGLKMLNTSTSAQSETIF
jgi:hypothetical protein